MCVHAYMYTDTYIHIRTYTWLYVDIYSASTRLDGDRVTTDFKLSKSTGWHISSYTARMRSWENLQETPVLRSKNM